MRHTIKKTANESEVRQVVGKLLDHARTDTQIEFIKILNWREYSFYQEQLESLKVVCRILRRSAKRLFSNYCKAVSIGAADSTKLTAYAQLNEILAFYEKDLSTVSDMIYEYEKYLIDHNRFIWALLGNRRDPNDEYIPRHNKEVN